jgi:hypothetical protein
MPDNSALTKRVFKRVGYVKFTELKELKIEYNKAKNIK